MYKMLNIHVFSSPFTAMSEKVFLPTCSRCWMCVWRSPSRGSSGHLTCTWVPPCWSGSTPGSTSPPVRPRPTRGAAEAEAGDCSLLFGWDIWPADADLWPLTSDLYCPAGGRERHLRGTEFKTSATDRDDDAPIQSTWGPFEDIHALYTFGSAAVSLLLSCLNEKHE